MREQPESSGDRRSEAPDGEDARGRYGDAGYNAGMAVFSYIIGGILVWSLIGWGLDNLLGTRWLVLAGGLLGAVGGFYLSHKHNLTRSSQTESGSPPEDGRGPAEGSQSDAK
ncbi:F0F1-type ATP synthase assembly protein I [Arthrobacter pigmenti]|uniref:F0F1-type ATP synthase assembly protein I n=1 Tax=Arthrobacter pigmenti TaxID=271432 RepID=A0A846RP19_9MICC|nr:F0F1-type ATP synthase assembly protein I [Arthrobacter pigmenti]